jgi:uncharacterized protein (DUF983 family)
MATRPPLPPTLANALRLRCPNCHEGRLFRGLPNRMFRKCPKCGLSYYRESGFYLGGMIITYVAVAFILLFCFLVSLTIPALPRMSESNEGFLWMGVAVLLTLLLVRPAYSLWLTMNFWIDPWKPGEFPSH